MSEKRVKIEVTPEITRQIAMKKVAGSSLRELEQEFGFSRPVVNRVLGSEIAKAVMKGLVDDAVAGAVVEFRQRLSKMTPLAMEAIEYQLRQKSLEAVKLYFKGMGIEASEKVEAPQQGLTIILPGQAAPKEVPNDIDISKG